MVLKIFSLNTRPLKMWLASLLVNPSATMCSFISSRIHCDGFVISYSQNFSVHAGVAETGQSFSCETGISSFPGAVSGLIVFTAVTADSFPLPSFGAAFSVFSFFCSFLSVFFSSAGKRSKREVSSKSGFCDIANSHLSEYKSIISWIGGRGNCF